MKPELVAYAIAAGALLHNLKLRLQLRKEALRREAEAEARRESVAQALGVNTVAVNGLEMPVPEYEHWTQKTVRLNDIKNTKVTLICVGKIHVAEDGRIWIDTDMDGLPTTPETKQYAADVWKCHRQRVIAQSLKQE
jgi:hypothetical protein